MLGALTVLMAAPATAAADSITFTVKDEAGRPQTGVLLAGTLRTNESGQMTRNAEPGWTARFSRQLADSSCGNTAPEGAQGVAYTVPDPVPDQATITLPTIIGAADFEPTQSAREVVGVINQARAENGLEPLYISKALTAVAAYEIQDPKNNCEYSLPTPALIDSGWPAPSDELEQVNRNGRESPWETVERLPQGQVLAPQWTTIGLGENSDHKWRVIFAPGCPAGASYYERCQITADAGVVPPPDPPPPEPDPEKVVPRIAKVKQKDHEISFLVHGNEPDARGRLQVVGRHDGHRKRIRAQRSAASLWFVERHLASGKWRIKVTFKPSNPKKWEGTTTCKEFKVKRHLSNRMKRRWTRLSVHSC